MTLIRDLVITLALISAGWAVWRRRKHMRYRWDIALTTSVALQFAGILLCLPTWGPVHRAVYRLTGRGPMLDLFGHLMLFSAIGCAIYAAACRLVPDHHIEIVMRRFEYPGAVAAATMLICFMSSKSLDTTNPDFFSLTGDWWLRTYWITWGTICIWGGAYFTRLMFALRADSRSRCGANIFIGACALGTMGGIAIVLHGMTNWDIPSTYVWVPVCVASAIAAIACARGFRILRPESRIPQQEEEHERD